MNHVMPSYNGATLSNWRSRRLRPTSIEDLLQNRYPGNSTRPLLRSRRMHAGPFGVDGKGHRHVVHLELVDSLYAEAANARRHERKRLWSTRNSMGRPSRIKIEHHVCFKWNGFSASHQRFENISLRCIDRACSKHFRT